MSDTMEEGLRARIASIVSNVVADSSQGQRVVALLEELFNEELGRKAGGWRDIETAPKDGAVILLFLPTWLKKIRFGKWGELSKGWLLDGDLLIDADGVAFWQPLPEPPATPAADALDDFKREMEEKVIPDMIRSQQERAILADEVRRGERDRLPEPPSGKEDE